MKPTLSFYIPCNTCKTNITQESLKCADGIETIFNDTKAALILYTGKCPKCNNHQSVVISTFETVLESDCDKFNEQIKNEIETARKMTELTELAKTMNQNTPPPDDTA